MFRVFYLFLQRQTVCLITPYKKADLSKKSILWPIPQCAIDANLYGLLRQNYASDGNEANCDEWQTREEAVADSNKTILTIAEKQ